MTPRFCHLICVVILLQGCATPTHSPNANSIDSRTDYVEYVDPRHNGTPCRILFWGGGAARIDLLDDRRHRARTFLVPTSAAAVSRLVRVLNTVDGAAFADDEFLTPGKDAASFRCAHAGKERLLPIALRARSSSHIADGIATEFESVGFFNLIIAIDRRTYAEDMAAELSEDELISWYTIAINTYIIGMQQYCSRYDIVYEPPVLEITSLAPFRVPVSSALYQRTAQQVKDAPKERSRILLAALRGTWETLTKDTFSVIYSEDVARISFVQDQGRIFEGGRSDISSVLPSDANRALNSRWNP